VYVYTLEYSPDHSPLVTLAICEYVYDILCQHEIACSVYSEYSYSSVQ
jgi:hypothetical protein